MADLQPGMTVRLEGTAATYTVVSTRMADPGTQWAEMWARLTTADGRPASWKACQLTPIDE